MLRRGGKLGLWFPSKQFGSDVSLCSWFEDKTVFSSAEHNGCVPELIEP